MRKTTTLALIMLSLGAAAQRPLKDTVKKVTIEIREDQFSSFGDLISIGRNSPVLTRSTSVTALYVAQTQDLADSIVASMNRAYMKWHPDTSHISKADTTSKK